ncbi:MAG: radical SAM protein [Planctomycetota bacterium]|jgi:hypothetical protein
MTLPVNKKIARVFGRKTNMTPVDEDVYFGVPPSLLELKYDEVHISLTFTGDLDVSMWAHLWRKHGTVKVGGPACGDPGGEFVPGLYLKKGVTITSRGCIRNCPFCYVPGREGKIRELKIHAGNIIQDNNLLACSKSHIKAVFEMLKTQKAIDFAGGLDCRLLKDWIIEELRSLRIKQLWFAYDSTAYKAALQRAGEKLQKYFNRDKLRCYVLIGYGNDTLNSAEARLRRAWEYGFLPFAMLYEPKMYTKDWYVLRRNWSRPAIMKSIMEPKKRNQMPLFE